MTRRRLPPTANLTTIRQTIARETATGYSLAVVADGLFATHALPSSGSIILGRGDDCDVRIDHPSVSRNHATLVLGDVLTVEDLGSSNGSELRGTSLVAGKPATVECGEVLMLGSVMVVVQERIGTATARRLWPHSYLTSRLEEECHRSSVDGTPCTLVRVRLVNGHDTSGLLAQMSVILDPRAIIAEYASGTIDCLLMATAVSTASQVAHELGAHADAAGLQVAVNTASVPEDGKHAHDLMLAVGQRDRGNETGESDEPIVKDARMRHLHELVAKVAVSDISVLLLGETGVGKEVLAQRIHELSARKDQPLLRLNCAALSEQLLESELFGHEKGAFTGADKAKLGLLVAANGGTVFLDEIGDLPSSVQVKLLRVLEERKVTPVGGIKSVDLDVRFVAATNVDLERAIYDGTFRSDLYFRLAGISLTIPPLRHRKSEIVPLARTFIARIAAQLGRPASSLSTAALALLEQYDWPGNIRELRNVVERALVLCEGNVIGAEHLPTERLAGGVSYLITQPSSPKHYDDGDEATTEDASGTPLAQIIEKRVESVERDQIISALARAGGNQTEAAKLLGVSRRTLLRRLDRYSIARPRKRD